MDREPKSVDIADFVASWPQIVEDLEKGLTSGVNVTRNGDVVALVRPPRRSLHGSMRGSVRIPEGFDLTAPVMEDETHAATLCRVPDILA